MMTRRATRSLRWLRVNAIALSELNARPAFLKGPSTFTLAEVKPKFFFCSTYQASGF